MQTKQLGRSVTEGQEEGGESEQGRNVLQDCKTSCWWWCAARRGDCECAMWKIAIKLWKCTLNYAPDMGSDCEGGGAAKRGARAISCRDWLAKVFSEKFCVRSTLSRRWWQPKELHSGVDWRTNLMGIWAATMGNLTGNLCSNLAVSFILFNIYNVYE